MFSGDERAALTRETIEVEGLPRDGRLWRVVWYCGIDRNDFATSEPRVLILLAFAESTVVEHRVVRIGITNLGIVRIGTRWRNGSFVSSVQTEVFQGIVDVSSEALITPTFLRDLALVKKQLATESVLGALEHTSAIRVTAESSSLTIIMPALELFSRCFGTSQFVKRTLATYSFRDAMDLLTAPDRVKKSQLSAGHQLITLSKRCIDTDGSFVARMKFDSFARRCVSKFCGSIQAFDDRRPNVAFAPNVSFWWRTPTLMRLRGNYISEQGQNIFLCYRIEGMEEIAGPPLTIDRENSNLIDAKLKVDAAQSIENCFARIPSPSITAQLVHSTEPSSDFSYRGVSEQPLVILNPKREIVRARSAVAGSSKRTYIPIDRSADSLSGADFGAAGSTAAPAFIRYAAETIPVDAESTKDSLKKTH